MNDRFRFYTWLGVILLTLVWTNSAAASAPTARVSHFEGDVLVQSGSHVGELSGNGFELQSGDMIQTRNGTAQIVFTDQSTLKVFPYTSVMLQQRLEEHGFWMFSSQRPTRRITCHVGKIHYASGAVSRTDAYMQSESAVCRLKGTAVDFGADSEAKTYLKIYEGNADIVGEVIQAFFKEPTVDEALKTDVYNTLIEAYDARITAEKSGDELDAARAELKLHQVGLAAAAALRDNPDKKVQTRAAAVGTAAAAGVTAAEARAAVAQYKKDVQKASAAAENARLAGDMAKAMALKKSLKRSIRNTDTVLKAVQQAADTADQQAKAAMAAAENQDRKALRQAAQAASESGYIAVKTIEVFQKAGKLDDYIAQLKSLAPPSADDTGVDSAEKPEAKVKKAADFTQRALEMARQAALTSDKTLMDQAAFHFNAALGFVKELDIAQILPADDIEQMQLEIAELENVRPSPDAIIEAYEPASPI